MKFNTICTINTWSDRFSQNGNFSILYVNDTIHIVEYKDSERSIMIDIDDINIHETRNSISFFFPRNSDDELFFEVKDNIEMVAFRNSITDCQAICELKLRLNSVLRDVYYAGLYSTLDIEAKVIICDEMERLKKDNPTIYFTSLLNSPELNRDLKVRQSSITEQQLQQSKTLIPFTDVYCIFCDCYKLNRIDLDFIVHPYVPKASNGKTVFMCSICIENWKEYREIAEHDNSLVIGEETNEEICSLCSDTPESLVLCSGCMRSYCFMCLQRILSLTEIEDMNKSDNNDWLCVCCIHDSKDNNTNTSIVKNPPLAKSAWKMITTMNSHSNTCNIKKGNNTHGYIVPFINKNKNNLNNNINNTGSTPKGITIANAAEMISKSINLDEMKTQTTYKSKTTTSKLNHNEDSDDSYHQLNDNINTTSNRNKRNRRLITMESSNIQINTTTKENKRKKNQLINNINEQIIPINNNILTEEFYCLQYYSNYKYNCEKYLNSTRYKYKKHSDNSLETDDLCFLCKDGGDLVECDWKCSTAKLGERCLKTYHQYCLSYEVKDSDENWCCPRHFCDFCGVKRLKYICKYCPISLCEQCPEVMVTKFGTNIYCVVNDDLGGKWCHTPTTPDVQYIICHACVQMIDDKIIHGSNQIKSDKLYKPELIEYLKNEIKDKLKFPGVFTGSIIGLYRKEPYTTTTTNNKMKGKYIETTLVDMTCTLDNHIIIPAKVRGRKSRGRKKQQSHLIHKANESNLYENNNHNNDGNNMNIEDDSTSDLVVNNDQYLAIKSTDDNNLNIIINDNDTNIILKDNDEKVVSIIKNDKPIASTKELVVLQKHITTTIISINTIKDSLHTNTDNTTNNPDCKTSLTDVIIVDVDDNNIIIDDDAIKIPLTRAQRKELQLLEEVNKTNNLKKEDKQQLLSKLKHDTKANLASTTSSSSASIKQQATHSSSSLTEDLKEALVVCIPPPVISIPIIPQTTTTVIKKRHRMTEYQALLRANISFTPIYTSRHSDNNSNNNSKHNKT